MRGTRNDEQLLVAFFGTLALHMLARHLLERVLREITAVGLLAVDKQHRVLDLVCPCQQRLVEERLASHHVPSVVGVARTLVVAARRLVVGMVFLHKPRRVVGKRVHHPTSTLVAAVAEVLRTLSRQCLALLLTLLRRVLALEIALHVHLAHVVHRGCHGGTDSGVDRSRVHRHAAPSADADDADTPGVDIVLDAEEVHCGKEVLRVDVGRSHATGLTPTLPREGGVECDGEESTLCHVLRIKSAALLLHCSERTADGDGRKGIRRTTGRVHVGSQLDAVTVAERDLTVVYLVALREHLVPLLCQCQCCVHIFFVWLVVVGLVGACRQHDGSKQCGGKEYFHNRKY